MGRHFCEVLLDYSEAKCGNGYVHAMPGATSQEVGVGRGFSPIFPLRGCSAGYVMVFRDPCLKQGMRFAHSCHWTFGRVLLSRVGLHSPVRVKTLEARVGALPNVQSTLLIFEVHQSSSGSPRSTILGQGIIIC